MIKYLLTKASNGIYDSKSYRKKWGLEVNLDKIQYLCVGGTILWDNLDLEYVKIKKFDQCTYLWIKLTETGRRDEAIKNRMTNVLVRSMAVETDLWRRAAERSRFEHVRNGGIKSRMKVSRTIAEDIEKQQVI